MNKIKEMIKRFQDEHATDDDSQYGFCANNFLNEILGVIADEENK